MVKFVIVGFDGLGGRGAMGPAMPALAGFLREWSWGAAHRAVFPVETYVYHPSIFSGANPRRHGIIANVFHNRPGTSEAAYFVGSDVASVEANDRRSPLIEVPTLGRLLGERGLTMRVIGSNSAGSTRLKHHLAGRYPGHLNLPIRKIDLTVPPEEIPAWRALHGIGHGLVLPDLAGSEAVVDSFFEVEVGRGLADVTVLWIGEPDHSSHHDGPTGRRTVEGLAQADEQFGRVLQWWRGREDEVQLAVVSDHGHVVIDRYSDLRGELARGGLRVVTPRELEVGAVLEEADLVMAGDYCVGLWAAREGDSGVLRKAVEILQASPDLGLLFSTNEALLAWSGGGIFPESLVLSDHPRSPDLRVVTFGDPVTGLVACEKGLPIGGGVHGGLLPP